MSGEVQLFTETQIKHMVGRFLGWKLPEKFSPDAGISFKAEFNEHTAHPMKHEPIGTNLLDATQAAAMVRHMVEGMPQPAPATGPFELRYHSAKPGWCKIKGLKIIVIPDHEGGGFAISEPEAVKIVAALNAALVERVRATREKLVDYACHFGARDEVSKLFIAAALDHAEAVSALLDSGGAISAAKNQ